MSLLYHRNDNRMSIKIYAFIKNNQLEIMVTFVEKFWKDELHEYFYILNEEDTKKLHTLLQQTLHSNKPLLPLMKEMFEGPECEMKYTEFCQKHNLTNRKISY